ncbi:MAG: hypothetical protein QME50_06115 [Candidatus Bathyarchaeota archaeon]|nr:hypothetical protein [Candidatus Bathyarchaeota archaeon]
MGSLAIMISIIGAGKVGSSAAFRILEFRVSDVVLIDIAENLAHGEAFDSFGVRSIDPRVFLTPGSYGLEPHPLEWERLDET